MYGKFFSEPKINALNAMAKEVDKIAYACNRLKNRNDLGLEQLQNELEWLRSTHLNKLKEVHRVFEKKLGKLKQFKPQDNITPEYLKTIENFFNRSIKKMNDAISMMEKGIQADIELEREKKGILTGLYQDQLNKFTYYLERDEQKKLLKQYDVMTRNRYQDFQVIEDYTLSLLMDRGGLRCTAAIPIIPVTDPIEIQINFFGTLDFASQIMDMEKGGPGQESLKKYEQLLLAKVDEVCAKASQQFPGRDFRLRVAGHSLGGSLAKGFAFSIQKACALHQNSSNEIMSKVDKNLSEEGQPIPTEAMQALKEELDANAPVAEYKHLSKIKGLTVYALGSPGISVSTDQKASLLTYYHDRNFLRNYNHHHRDDKVVQFGETEFLAGQNGIKPRVAVNKAIQYELAVTAQEISEQQGLPFPDITPEVMAKHNKLIFKASNNHSVISDLAPETTAKKNIFPLWKKALYEAGFALKRLAAFIRNPTDENSSLYSYPESSEVNSNPRPK